MDDDDVKRMGADISQHVRDGRALFDAMINGCDPDRADMLKEKLDEYARGAFMGERNADVYIAIIGFVTQYVANMPGQDELCDLRTMGLAVQLGLQEAFSSYTDETGET